jgi:hypothetical protein
MSISRQQRRHAARTHASAPVTDIRVLNLQIVGAGKAFMDGGAATFLATKHFVLAVRMELPEGAVPRAGTSLKVSADAGNWGHVPRRRGRPPRVRRRLDVEAPRARGQALRLGGAAPVGGVRQRLPAPRGLGASSDGARDGA